MTKVINIKDCAIGEGIPKICASVVANDNESIIKDIRKLNRMDVDLIELRIDYLKDFSKIEELFEKIKKAKLKKPIIFTYRSVGEGGNGLFENSDYLALYRMAIYSDAFDIYDIELSRGTNMLIILENEIHEKEKTILVSCHDFNRTPSIDTMMEKFNSMDQFGGDILKMAVMPEDDGDLLALLQLNAKARNAFDKPIITMSMDKIGIPSRFLGEQFGSAVTFGMVGEASAPGQIDVKTLRNVLNIIHENMYKDETEELEEVEEYLDEDGEE